MAVAWTFQAETYLDQLPPAEQAAAVLRAVERLPADRDGPGDAGLNRLTGGLSGLVSLRAGPVVQVLVRRAGDDITVVDVIRSGQIDGLRRLWALRPGASGEGIDDT